MTTVTAVLAFAALFAAFGLLRPKRSCATKCGGCSRACERLESNDGEV